MNSDDLPEKYHASVERCPWCDGHCMYLEEDEFCGFRVGAICDEADAAYEAIVGERECSWKDWGRAEWEVTVKLAIEEWNATVVAGRKTGQRGVW